MSHAGYDFSNESIIVVDDETFSLSIVTQLCRSIGFKEVKSEKSVNSALTALRFFSPKNPPFIIADFRMPEHNGLELLKAVRMGLIHPERSLPVLMLTGHTDAHLVSLALKLDVDAFIAKPVSKGVLEKRLIQIALSERKVKSVAEYGLVQTYVASIEAVEEVIEKPNTGHVITLADLKEGDKLAAPIRLLSDKKILIEQGEVLNSRLIARLHDLHEMGSVVMEIRIY